VRINPFQKREKVGQNTGPLKGDNLAKLKGGCRRVACRWGLTTVLETTRSKGKSALTRKKNTKLWSEGAKRGMIDLNQRRRFR